MTTEPTVTDLLLSILPDLIKLPEDKQSSLNLLFKMRHSGNGETYKMLHAASIVASPPAGVVKLGDIDNAKSLKIKLDGVWHEGLTDQGLVILTEPVKASLDLTDPVRCFVYQNVQSGDMYARLVDDFNSFSVTKG